MKTNKELAVRHACIALGLATVATFARLSAPAPDEPSVEGLARMLSAASQSRVSASSILWEPSGGLLWDASLGRRVLFVASSAPGAPNDLFRARVRVGPEGHPIEVMRSVNLTSSPLGDTQGLIGHDHSAAYVMVAYGAVQQITLLDLHGERASTLPSHWSERVLAHLTNLQETDSFDGLGRTEIATTLSSPGARLALSDSTLNVTPEANHEAFGVDLQTGDVIASAAADHAGATSLQVPHLPKPVIIWAVDTVRAWTGPGPIAWLEDQVFNIKDLWQRLVYTHFSSQRPASVAVRPAPTPLASASSRSAAGTMPHDDVQWPPAPIPSIWDDPDPDEGKWEPVQYPFLKHVNVPGAKHPAPAYFYRTVIKPDSKRPYAKVILVAMDSRQLQLGMEGGVEDPKPLTGAHGEGRIPRDPAVLSRVVGAFNGAFKTTHGQYGMMVNRRVLLPPKAGAATVVVNRRGLAGFGTWPSSTAIPDDIVSFRQNLDPLIEDQKLNPSGRTLWGFQLPGTGVTTHRSGLCLTPSGTMIYAWGPEVSATSLGEAMIQAGCTYGLHLDMNPHHTAFSFLDVRDAVKKDYDAKLLTTEMETLAERFINWSAKDFFYLMLRSFEPPHVDGMELRADDGLQPSPDWAPAVFQGVRNEDGVRVELMAFSPDRVGYGLVPAGGHGADDGLLASIGLGASAPKAKSGAHASGASMPAETAQLAVVGGGLRLVASARELPAGVEAVELPALRLANKTTAGASIRSVVRRRAALCVSSDGFAWLAQTTASLDKPLADALDRVGCETVALVDRGAHEPPELMRTGIAGGTTVRDDQPVLQVVGRALAAGAFRWSAEGVATK